MVLISLYWLWGIPGKDSDEAFMPFSAGVPIFSFLSEAKNLEEREGREGGREREKCEGTV